MRFRETVYGWRKAEGGGGAVEKWENCLNEVVITRQDISSYVRAEHLKVGKLRYCIEEDSFNIGLKTDK